MEKGHIERYKEVVSELIKKSFPELRGKNIRLVEGYVGKYSAREERDKIRVNKNIRDLSARELIGLFAHELCHVEDAIKRSPIEYFLFNLQYILFKQFKKRIEEDTDKRAIKKGYAGELYAYRKSVWDDPEKKKMRRYYFSPQEIKIYAKKIRKW